jgi:hypothetical protein
VENYYIKSVSEFIDQVFKRVKELKGESETAIWFRGEASEEYSLVPNLYRKTYKDKELYCSNIQNPKEIQIVEQNIDASFYRKATVFFANKKIENTPWNRYFLKQHYGITTRLLDWTENALYALFFAVQKDSNVNGKVCILLPYILNNYSVSKFLDKDIKFNRIFTLTELNKKADLLNEKKQLRIMELFRQYYKMDFDENIKAFPLAVYPPHLDERMSAQQACFTLFGNITKGLHCEHVQDKFLDCIYIAAESKNKILKELRLLGISYYSIYPDLDGLGKTINFDHYKDITQVQSNNDFLNFLPDLER